MIIIVTFNDFHVNPLFYQHVTFEIFEELFSNELQWTEITAISIFSDEKHYSMD